MWKSEMNQYELADLIERFLDSEGKDSAEWDYFVDRSQQDKVINSYARLCFRLDPFVNHREEPDTQTISELRGIVERLRTQHPLIALTKSEITEMQKAASHRSGWKTPAVTCKFCIPGLVITSGCLALQVIMGSVEQYGQVFVVLIFLFLFFFFGLIASKRSAKNSILL